MDPAPVISLAQVSKSFGNVKALIDVDLDLREGEVHVVLGENGAGKSTLAAILAGIHQPDEGEIRIRDKKKRLSSPRDALRRGISTVFQHAQLVPSLSVVDNMALGGTWWRRPAREQLTAQMRQVSREMDPASPIDPEARIDALSLGEKQRAEIVRALMRGSQVLVLDESTATLTPQGAEDLGRLMRRLVRGEIAGRDGAHKPMAVMFITHKLDEALDFGDRITIMRRGRKVAEILPKQMDWDRATAHREIIKLMFAGDAAYQSIIRRKKVASSLPSPVLTVKGLAVDDQRIPLTDLNLTLSAGEVLGIAGIDGNGQRQLAEALAGQRSAKRGSIILDDKVISHLPVGERSRLGLRYASDDRLREGTIGALSIAFNLLLKRIGDRPFWQRGIAQEKEIAANAQVAITDFDIRTPDGETPVGHLSGGNVQKVVLARELSKGARAIIFAKPTHGLDIQSTIACRHRIRQAADAGLAVLLISTDLDEILELCDRIMVMAEGRLSAVFENGPQARAQVGAAISQVDGKAA